MMIYQISSTGKREVFLDLNKVRKLLDTMVLNGRGDISVQLIKQCWTGPSLRDTWMLKMSVPLADKKEYLSFWYFGT